MKNKKYLLIPIIISAFTLHACSDESEVASDVSMEAKKESVTDSHSTAEVMKKDTTNTSTSSMKDGQQVEINIYQLANDAGYAQVQAKRSGFEWTTIQPLMDQAHEAMKMGKMDKARDLFKHAIKQSELAIQQSKYADEHWQLLVPKS